MDWSSVSFRGQATTSTPTVPMSRYMNGALQRPHPVDQRVLFAFERRALEHVDGDDGVAALAQIDQRQARIRCRACVEKRDDDRTRRHAPRAAPMCPWWFEFVAGAEHGVEHPVELALPDVGAQPARPTAAERDDAGAVTVAQRALHHLGGAAQRPLGRLGRRARRLRVHVDQHHHIGGAVGQPLR